MSSSAASPQLWHDATIGNMLTKDRLSSYLRATSGDLEHALLLYEWNTRAAGAVIQTVALTEVLLRNSMDRRLIAWARKKSHQGSWLSVIPLDSRGIADIRAARFRATKSGKRKEVHGKVIAELSFGFWRYLVTRRYLTTLWIPALKDAFPHGTADIGRRRAEVEQTMNSIVFIRNRAAHHEPIHRRDLVADFQSIVALCHWMHPEAGAWVASTSTLPGVIAERTELGI